jgi:hypothetical protein
MPRASFRTSQGRGHGRGSPGLPSASCPRERAVRLRAGGYGTGVCGTSVTRPGGGKPDGPLGSSRYSRPNTYEDSSCQETHDP